MKCAACGNRGELRVCRFIVPGKIMSVDVQALICQECRKKVSDAILDGLPYWEQPEQVSRQTEKP